MNLHWQQSQKDEGALSDRELGFLQAQQANLSYHQQVTGYC